ncbi:MAG: hypothetical protein JXJ17_06040 [Anaerolineae bacterium]|nr:hypothetical protein [Anaerolineae bacterium]
MPVRHFRLCLIALLAAAALAACAAPTETPAATYEVIEAPTLTSTPPTDSIPLPSPTSPPTTVAEAVGLLGQLPYVVTDEEALAAAAGEATYSGYACVITPEGCACELPELRQVSITFQEDETARYVFNAEGISAAWILNRLAPNQWEYKAPIISQEREAQIGDVRIMFSFTPYGYVYSQVVHYYEVGLVVCPEVTFRRID